MSRAQFDAITAILSGQAGVNGTKSEFEIPGVLAMRQTPIRDPGGFASYATPTWTTQQ
jgi:hypothetical protein